MVEVPVGALPVGRSRRHRVCVVPLGVDHARIVRPQIEAIPC
jgi:hypothetical protein